MTATHLSAAQSESTFLMTLLKIWLLSLSTQLSLHLFRQPQVALEDVFKVATPVVSNLDSAVFSVERLSLSLALASQALQLFSLMIDLAQSIHRPLQRLFAQLLTDRRSKACSPRLRSTSMELVMLPHADKSIATFSAGVTNKLGATICLPSRERLSRFQLDDTCLSMSTKFLVLLSS